MSESRRACCTASLLLLVLLSSAPASAQAVDTDEPLPAANTVRMDDPSAQKRTNREVWESVKKTPYSDALQHIASVRALSANAATTVTLPTGWQIAPAGVQINLGHLPFDALPFNGSVV